MAKKFSELRDKMPAHARELAHQRATAELARLNQAFEPDVVEWLQAQNADTKHYVNEMVRNVMKLQSTALQAGI